MTNRLCRTPVFLGSDARYGGIWIRSRTLDTAASAVGGEEKSLPHPCTRQNNEQTLYQNHNRGDTDVPCGSCFPAGGVVCLRCFWGLQRPQVDGSHKYHRAIFGSSNRTRIHACPHLACATDERYSISISLRKRIKPVACPPRSDWILR